MNTDAVIGCDAVEAGDAWLRLKTAGGAMRTVPWAAIKIAGMGGNHEGHMQISHVTDKVTPFFATHDSLWIVYAEGGLAQVMIEKVSPKRDRILATFAQKLGIAWRGDEFTTSELTGALFQMPLSAGKGIPKITKIVIAVMTILLLAAIAAGFLASRHR
ncbi:MAG TPA: hypothetical protein VK752_13370 [Bryobacteraceae bacterium]|jgi:hypothetical protein|nr:hypothetical protein [Bryobacteraceae bacterium]